MIQYATIVLVVIAIIVSAISYSKISGMEIPQNFATSEEVSNLNEEIQGIKDDIQELKTNQGTILDQLGAKTPANITVDSISAPTVNAGEQATITVTVKNTGEQEGTKDIRLLIDGEEADTQSVTVAGGETKDVEFQVTRSESKDYEVSAGELSKVWTVEAEEVTSEWIGSGELDGNGIPPDFFSDRHVRLGFCYAFDYETYIQDAFLGQGIKVPGPIPSSFPYFNEDQEMFSYNPEQAEKHFKMAFGGSVEDPGPVWENGFEFTMLYNSGNTQRKLAADIWADKLGEINPEFVVKVDSISWDSYLGEMVAGRLPIFIIGWIADFPDPHNFVVPFMDSQGTFSKWQGYSDPEVDDLINQGISTVDSEERREAYYELQEIYHEDAPSVPLCEPTVRSYQRDWVENWFYNPIYPGDPYWACTKKDTAKRPDTLIDDSIGEPETLDPAWSYDTASGEVIFNVYETLIDYDRSKTDEFVPQLATDWEILDDGMTYRFKIREGVKFHNGNELTPEDVEYSLERTMIYDRAGGPSWMLLEPLVGTKATRAGEDEWNVTFDNIDKSVTVDGQWVTLNLAKPYPPFMAILAQSWASIIDKEWAVEQGAWPGTEETWKEYNNPDTPVLQEGMNGTGPYKFDRWEQGDQVVLKSNEDYWGDAPSIETVKIRLVEEWSTRKSTFLAGDSDITYVPRQYSSEIEGEEGITVYENLPNAQTNPAAFFQFEIT